VSDRLTCREFFRAHPTNAAVLSMIAHITDTTRVRLHGEEFRDIRIREYAHQEKIPQVDHETDVEKWFIDRHRSEKSVPQAAVVGTFT
jgi:hypothetical protein